MLGHVSPVSVHRASGGSGDGFRSAADPRGTGLAVLGVSGAVLSIGEGVRRVGVQSNTARFHLARQADHGQAESGSRATEPESRSIGASDVLQVVRERGAYATLASPSVSRLRFGRGRDAALATEPTYGTCRRPRVLAHVRPGMDPTGSRDHGSLVAIPATSPDPGREAVGAVPARSGAGELSVGRFRHGKRGQQ